MSLTRLVRTGFHVDVLDWQRAVVVRDGHVQSVEGGGRHRRRRREEWWVFDVRSRRVVVPTQDVLTSDGVQVRVSVLAKYSVADPEKWIAASTDVESDLYASIQLSLREAVAAVTLEALLTDRQSLLEPALEPTQKTAATLGIELESLDVRDLTLGQELRRAFAQTALAREAGKARLEAARGEAAALRSLANTAELLEKHPSLIQLRALEVAESTDSKLVLRIGDGLSDSAG